MAVRARHLLAAPLTAAGFALTLLVPTPAGAATPVDLGTASSFAVLAGSTATNTGPSTIDGDVGVSPGTALTGFGTATVNGTQHAHDGVADRAQTDLTTAYDTAAGESPATPVATELGGQVFTAGVYTAPTLGLTGTVTLDAGNDPGAVFVFQAGSTLTTASDSRVVLTGRADPCNVFWQVGSSATLGTRSVLAGSVLALTSISATTGATVTGRLLARNGATTLDSDTITVPSCARTVPTPAASPTAGPTATATPTPTSGPTPTASSTAGPAPSTTPPATPGASAAALPAGVPRGTTAGTRTARTPALDLGRGSTAAGAGGSPTSLALTGAPVSGLAATGLLAVAGGLLLLLCGRPARRRRS